MTGRLNLDILGKGNNARSNSSKNIMEIISSRIKNIYKKKKVLHSGIPSSHFSDSSTFGVSTFWISTLGISTFGISTFGISILGVSKFEFILCTFEWEPPTTSYSSAFSVLLLELLLKIDMTFCSFDFGFDFVDFDMSIFF